MGEGLLQYLAEKGEAIRETWKELHAIPEPERNDTFKIAISLGICTGDGYGA